MRAYVKNIFAVGGNNEGDFLSLEKCDVNLRKWTSLEPITGKRNYSACVALGGEVIITGGHDGKQVLREVNANHEIGT